MFGCNYSLSRSHGFQNYQRAGIRFGRRKDKHIENVHDISNIATIIADDEIPAEVIGRDCIPEAHHEMHLIIENTADSQEVNTVSLLRTDLRGIDQEQLALPAARFPYHSD